MDNIKRQNDYLMDYLMDEYMRQHLLDEIERKRKGFFRIWFQIIERSAIISLLHPPKEKTQKRKKEKRKTSLHYCALGINISFFFTFSSKFQFIVSHWMREADAVYSCDCVRMVRHSTSIN
jgi:hypothetical protein